MNRASAWSLWARRRWPAWVIVMWCLGALASAPPGGGGEPRPAEDVLALLRERNVFDPNRRAQRRDEPREERAEPPRTESVVLTGALLHDATALGFFDGSAPAYRCVLAPGEEVAGYVVAEVTTSGVGLEKDGSRVWLAVGSSLQRVGEGEWKVSEEPWAGRGESRSPEPAKAGAGASDGSGATDQDEILRRMMERRRQEDSQ